MRSTAWLVLSVSLLNAPCLSGQSPTAPELAKRSFPSIVLITVNDATGQPLAIGSGFVVAPGIVATNRHVLEGGSSAKVKLIGGSSTLTANGFTAVDPSHDLALLSVPALNAPQLTLFPDPIPDIGERIYAIGNPRGLEGTFSDGIVSGIRALANDTLLQVTAPISPGSSGGPVLNQSGQVVGVSVATIEGGQSLNFAVPVTYLSRLLLSQSGVQSIASIRTKPLTKVARGTQTTTGVSLTLFRWSPDELFAGGGDCFGTFGCEFTFSVRNRLSRPVKKVRYIVIFYDRTGEPLDTHEGDAWKAIGAGLAIRESGSVDASVRRLTARTAFRVLDYEFAD